MFNITSIKDTHKLDTLFLSGSRKDGSLPSNKKIYIYNYEEYLSYTSVF